MAISLISVGTAGGDQGFDRIVQPTPGTFAVNDFWIYQTGEFKGSDSLPAVPSGWTYLGDGTVAGLTCWGHQVATLTDTVPSVLWGNAWQYAQIYTFRGLDPGFTLTFITASRAQTVTQNVASAAVTRTPNVNNSLILFLWQRNKTSSTNGVTWTAPNLNSNLDFTLLDQAGAASNGSSNVAWGAAYCIQPVATTMTPGALVATGSNPAESTGQSAESLIIGIAPGSIVATSLAGDQETPPPYPAPKPHIATRGWIDVPFALQHTAPPVLPPIFGSAQDVPVIRQNAVDNRSAQVNLQETTLVGQDRVLAPVNWNYTWDSAQKRMPVALRDQMLGLTISEMTALTTFPPYTEFNWPVPQPRPYRNQSIEASFPLELIGKDNIPLGALYNLSWDPPARKPATTHLLDTNTSSGLALKLTVQVKPPLSYDLPVPRGKQAPVQDWMQSMPLTIRAFLSIQPPATASTALPVRRASSVPLGFESSILPLLLGQDVIPFGISSVDRPTIRQAQPQLYDTNDYSIFIPSTIPPIIGPGVLHMGRTVLDPVSLGEAIQVPMDFLSGLQPSEVLINASVTAQTYMGTDLNPQAIVTGPAQVSGSIALQQITPTIEGVTYDLIYKAITSLGNVLQMTGYLSVIPHVP